MPLVFLLVAFAVRVAAAQAPIRLEEITIADLESALVAKRVTCRWVVGQYLRRIDAYDKNGPAINALVVVNPAALAVADSLAAGAFATLAGFVLPPPALLLLLGFCPSPRAGAFGG